MPATYSITVGWDSTQTSDVADAFATFDQLRTAEATRTRGPAARRMSPCAMTDFPELLTQTNNTDGAVSAMLSGLPWLYRMGVVVPLGVIRSWW